MITTKNHDVISKILILMIPSSKTYLNVMKNSNLIYAKPRKTKTMLILKLFMAEKSLIRAEFAINNLTKLKIMMNVQFATIKVK